LEIPARSRRRRDRSIGYVVFASLVTAACHSAPPRVAPVPAPDTTGRGAASAESARALAQDSRTIGVLPFGVAATDTTITPLAYGLADLLMTDLSRSAEVHIVDRLRLDAIIRELQLVSSGRVDSASAPRAGRLIGARRLVLGRLASGPGGALIINARITDVSTGRVNPAVSARAPLASILDAEKALALELFHDLGVALTPAELAAVQQQPTKNIAALLAYSRAVQDEVGGDLHAADAHLTEAVRLDPRFALAQERLTSVRTQELAPQTAARPAPKPPPRATTLARLTAGLVDEVNPSTLSPVAAQAAGPADAAFPLSQLITIFVAINVP